MLTTKNFWLPWLNIVSLLTKQNEKNTTNHVPDYSECFLKIANHLSYRPNFINYTFRDDMISDG